MGTCCKLSLNCIKFQIPLLFNFLKFLNPGRHLTITSESGTINDGAVRCWIAHWVHSGMEAAFIKGKGGRDKIRYVLPIVIVAFLSLSVGIRKCLSFFESSGAHWWVGRVLRFIRSKSRCNSSLLQNLLFAFRNVTITDFIVVCVFLNQVTCWVGQILRGVNVYNGLSCPLHRQAGTGWHAQLAHIDLLSLLLLFLIITGERVQPKWIPMAG